MSASALSSGRAIVVVVVTESSSAAAAAAEQVTMFIDMQKYIYAQICILFSFCITFRLVLTHHHHRQSLNRDSGELRTQKLKSHLNENTELMRSPFKAWSRSVYSHTCYAYCQGFLSRLFLPFRSIHLHMFQNLSRFFLCWLWLTHGSCVVPQNKLGHSAGYRFPC